MGQPDNLDGMSQDSGARRSVDCTPGKSLGFQWGEVGDISSSSLVCLIRPLLPGPGKHSCSENVILWNVAVEKELSRPLCSSVQTNTILPSLSPSWGGTQG